MFLKGLVSRCFDIFHSKPSGLLTNRIKYLANGWVFLPVLCETAQASTLQIVVKKAGKQHAGYYTCGKVCIQVVWVELLTVKYCAESVSRQWNTAQSRRTKKFGKTPQCCHCVSKLKSYAKVFQPKTFWRKFTGQSELTLYKKLNIGSKNLEYLIMVEEFYTSKIVTKQIWGKMIMMLKHMIF